MSTGFPSATARAIASAAVERVAVVVPARNEAERLVACLLALTRAVAALRQGRPSIEVVVVVVLDSCDDGSAAIAAGFRGVVVDRVDVANVGAARAAGVAVAARLLGDGLLTAGSLAEDLLADGPVPDAGDGGSASTWIATTDADSMVPESWLLDQIALAEAGADAVLGSVVPVRAELSDLQALEWDRRHPDGPAVGTVHGANLGVREAAYRRAGGFEALAVHEDVGLVAALRRTGAVVVASTATPVTTSGRSVGRAPGGYTDYLRSLVPAAS